MSPLLLLLLFRSSARFGSCVYNHLLFYPFLLFFFVNIFDLERVFVTTAAAAGTSVGRAQAEPQPPAHAHTSRCRFGRGGEKKPGVVEKSWREVHGRGVVDLSSRLFPPFRCSLSLLSPPSRLLLEVVWPLLPFPLSLFPLLFSCHLQHTKKNIRNRKRLCGFFLGRVLLMRSLFSFSLSLSLCYNFDCTFSNY